MQLDAQPPTVRLHAQLMHAHVVARGHCAHTVEDALSPGLARHRVDHHVGLGQRAVRRLRSCPHQFSGVLKGKAPRQRQRQIGKVPGSGTPHARLLHSQHAVDLLHLMHQPLASLHWNLIHQDGHGLAPEHQSQAQNHERNHHRRKGVGVAEPADAIVGSSPTGAKPTQHRQSGPDIAGKVKGIGSQRRRPGSLCHGAQLPRTPVIDSDRGQKHQYWPHRVAQLHRVEEDPLHCLPDDPRARKGHQDRLAKCGEVLNLAVAVGMIIVGRLVAHLDGKEGQRRPHQIESRVRRIRQHAEGARKQTSRQLQQSHGPRRQHRVQRHAPLLSGVPGETGDR